MKTLARRMPLVSTAALGVVLSLFSFAPLTSADVSPVGCLNNDFVVNLNKSTAIAYDETSPNGATVITYSVSAGNPQDGNNQGCNVDGVTITVTDPHGVSHTVQTGGNYPIGTAVTTLGTTVSYTAASGDEVSDKLTATVHATGDLHDTPSGTDPLDISKAVSITTIHPDTTVAITPSTTTVTSGGTVALTVTEKNTGDDPIRSPSVTVDNGIGTLSTTSASFTGGDTGADGILGVGETWSWTVPGVVINAATTFTATGDGLDSLGHHVTFSAYPDEQATTSVRVFNTPTIATTLSNPGPVAIGSAVHDSSALTGATATAGGTVSYAVYTGSSCSGTSQSAGTKTVTNGVVPDSDPITFNTAGTYNWQAVYSGDAANAAATSTCQTETLVVNPATPTITTTLVPAGPVSVGTAVHDSAVLHNATANATGTVAYNVYTDSACTLGAQSAGTKTVTAGVVPDSDPITFNTPGDFYWQATYSGDANNTGPVKSTCTEEHLVVQQGTPTLTTTASASVPVGSDISDVAHLAGGTSPQGTITFDVYGPGDTTCATPLAGSPIAALTNPGGDGDYTSNNVLATLVGTYRWIAHYVSSDANNANVSTACNDAHESVVVTKLAPSISTALSATTINVNTPVHDSSTITGATSDAGGTVTYNVYAGTACTGTPVFTNPQTVTNGVVPDSGNFTPTSAGTYNWQAVYSGDTKNEGATSACQSEVLTVSQPAGQYCSPGYWKQSQHFDSYVGYLPTDSFFSVFGRHITIMWSAKGKPAPLTDPTLLQALEANGGGINLIAREAVDALLNSTALNFGFTSAQVIAAVQQAIDQNNPSLLNQFNLTESCPLN